MEIILGGFLIAAIVIWLSKKIFGDFVLAIWIILFAGCPLSYIAFLISQYNIPLVVYGVVLAGFFVLLIIAMDLRKRHVMNQWSHIHDETNAFNLKQKGITLVSKSISNKTSPTGKDYERDYVEHW